jgi:hypothetical protein
VIKRLFQNYWVWLIPLGVIGLVIYYPGFIIQYYGDDYMHAFDYLTRNVLYFATHENPYTFWYRPFQGGVMVAIQNYFGVNPAPVHLTALILHVLLSWIVYWAMIRFGFSRLQAILASLFILFSQANSHAVLSNDCLSQVFGGFWGYLGLIWLGLALPRLEEHHRPTALRLNLFLYSLSVLAFLLALASKESSTSFFIIIMMLISWDCLRSDYRHKLVTLAVRVLPYLVVAAVYFAQRSFVIDNPPAFGSGKYNFRLGLNVAQNLAQFGFSALVSASSVSVFTSLAQGRLVFLAGAIGGTLLLMGAVARGIWISGQRARAGLMALFAVIAMFPMAGLNHVSELYTYNAMPFISVLVGLGLGSLIGASKSRASRILLWVLFAVLLISNAGAIREKAQLMRQNGERSAVLMQQIVPYIRTLPPHGELLLVNPPQDIIEYSVYHIRGFNIFRDARHRIKLEASREDIRVRIINFEDFAENSLSEKTIALTSDRDRVRKINSPD